MKRLWVAAALAPLSFAATMAHADKTITGGNTTLQSTSADVGNITIDSGGDLHPSTGPAAITVDATGNVSNSGTISYSGVSNTAGILVDTSAGAITSTITNSGTITVSESTTGDSTNQSITSGPFANGSARYGIRVSGANTFNGSITNTGTITVIGENSAAIDIGSEMTGGLVQTGTITVTGGTPTYATAGKNSSAVTNAGNVSYGINATGKIDGNVNVGGTVSVTGQNATGVALSGGVGGGVEIDGSISATGYRSTTAPTDPKVLAKLNPDQTLQGGPALVIGGSVGSGITVDASVAASGNTSAVTEGTITSMGSAPAVLIGGADALTVGANTSGYSLQNGGAISGLGEYADVSATAIQIGGDNTLAVASSGVDAGSAFGAVTLSGGIDNTGSISSVSEEHTAGAADSTGISIGSGATVSSLVNSGTIVADAASDATVSTTNPSSNETSVTGKSVPITVAAINVAAGGSLTSINNSGTIDAEITGISTATNYTAAGGTQGQAVAILDASGTLTSVTNTNTIAASITPIVYGQTVSSTNADVVAMYLANQSNSITVTQSAYTGNSTSTVTPSITGEIIFGRTDGTSTGSEILDVQTGNVTGNIVFNGVGSDSLTIDGNATVTGGLTQSAAGSLTIDVNSGLLDMTSPTSNVLGGSAASINVSSLHVGSTGEIIFTVDPTATSAGAQFNVTGTATFDQGAKLGISLESKLTQTSQTYTLIHAGTLAGNATDSSLLGTLPYLYQGAISETANDIDITVSLKTAAQLGFNPAQASAYSAIYSQMSTDQDVESLVLSQTTRSGLLSVYNQFLPDYAGGPFEAIASAQRAIARAQADAPVKMQSDETRGWVQEIGFSNSRSASSLANGYQAKGFGVAVGVEHAHGDSAIGLTGSVVSSGVEESTQAPDASLSVLAIEGGAYWRAGGEGLNVNASVNGGYVSLGSHRLLLNQTASGAVSLLRDAESQWSGAVASAQFGVAYQITKGRFYMRPEVNADYIALYETAHSERGGGQALDLAINSRLSQEGSVQADVVFGWNFGEALRWRPELTLGYREIVAGGAADTVARFLSGGGSFTLSPDNTDKGGLLARLGIRAGGTYADVTADAGGEFRNGYQTYDARAVARFLF
ncbi:MAG: hypothetical protein P4L73_09480 [Caulobacteraceae bacterium]|nr:hypothetical protein [Caulobacteraceae bacterium]